MNTNIENRMRAYLLIDLQLDFCNKVRDDAIMCNDIDEINFRTRKIGFLRNAKRKVANALIFLLKEENQ